MIESIFTKEYTLISDSVAYNITPGLTASCYATKSKTNYFNNTVSVIDGAENTVIEAVGGGCSSTTCGGKPHYQQDIRG